MYHHVARLINKIRLRVSDKNIMNILKNTSLEMMKYFASTKVLLCIQTKIQSVTINKVRNIYM